MKKIIVFLCLIGSFTAAFPSNSNPDKDGSPQDTLKAYYLDEVVVTTSVKETNQLKNLPSAVSIISPRQLKNSRIESLPDLSGMIPNFFIPS